MIIRVVVDRHLDDGVERVGALEKRSARCSTACCRIDRQPSTSHTRTLSLVLQIMGRVDSVETEAWLGTVSAGEPEGSLRRLTCNH